jgi:hypothetical protein
MGEGFLVRKRSSLPLLKTYSEATPQEAGQALESGRQAPVRVEKDGHQVVLEDLGAARSLLSVYEGSQDSVPLDGLARLDGATQARVLKSFDKMSVSDRRSQLKLMAEHTVLPGDFGSQLAQALQIDPALVSAKPEHRLNGRIPKESELAQVVDHAQDMGIDFGYLESGCNARAHALCDAVRNEGMNSSKLFVHGKLKAEGQKPWRYHVGTVVFVDTDDGGVEPRVLDPGLSKAPIHPAEWVKKFWTNGKPIEIDSTSDRHYSNRTLVDLPFDWNLKTAWEDIKFYNNVAEESR